MVKNMPVQFIKLYCTAFDEEEEEEEEEDGGGVVVVVMMNHSFMVPV